MSTISLPALAVRPPQQQEDPLQQASRMVELRSLLQAQPVEQQIRRQQLQNAQLQNQAQQYQLDRTNAMNQAYKDAFTVDDSGNSRLDQGKLTQSLAQAGHGAAVPEIMKHYNEYQQSQVKLQKDAADLQVAQQDSLGSLGAAVKAAKYDPQFTDALIQDRLNQPNLAPQMKQQLGQMRMLFQQDPTKIQALADNLIAQSPKQRELTAQETTAKARATAARFRVKDGAFYDLSTGSPKPVTGEQIDSQ